MKGRRSDVNEGRAVVEIGGVLQHFSDKLYELGVPKKLPTRE